MIFSHVLYQLSYLAVVEKRTLGALRARYSTRCGGHIMGTARAHFKPVSNVGLCGLPRRLPTRTEAPLCPSCAHDGLRAHPGERCVLPHGCDDYRQVAVPVNDERCDRQDPAASGSASRSATFPLGLIQRDRPGPRGRNVGRVSNHPTGPSNRSSRGKAPPRQAKRQGVQAANFVRATRRLPSRAA